MASSAGPTWQADMEAGHAYSARLLFDHYADDTGRTWQDDPLEVAERATALRQHLWPFACAQCRSALAIWGQGFGDAAKEGECLLM